MSTVALAAVAVVSLACPAHMLWRMRRHGATAADCAHGSDAKVDALRRRQRDLEARIAELTVDDEDGSVLPAGPG